MAESFMLRKEYGENICILDLGYYTNLQVEKVADIIVKEIGKKNIQLDCDGFLKANITKHKEKLLNKFKQIEKGGKHWKGDYHWKYKDDLPYNVKFHPLNIKNKSD